MKYIINFVFLVLGFLLGCYASYLLLDRIVEDGITSAVENSLAETSVYESRALVHMAQTVSDGNVDEFYNLTCGRIASDLETYEKEFDSDKKYRAEIDETIKLMKDYLAEMKASSKCKDQ